jgi:hypothetical protein
MTNIICKKNETTNMLQGSCLYGKQWQRGLHLGHDSSANRYISEAEAGGEWVHSVGKEFLNCVTAHDRSGRLDEGNIIRIVVWALDL